MVKKGHCKQVRQAVVRLFLRLDDFVHAEETAAGEVITESFCFMSRLLNKLRAKRLH